MNFNKAINRDHRDIVHYFFYEGQDSTEFPNWFETSMQDEETGEVTFTVKGYEFDTSRRKMPIVRILQLAQVAVLVPTKFQPIVEVLDYSDFADRYQRVED